DDIETYVHRSGRTGRADKRGICISLVHLREKHKIKQIEKIVGRPIERAMIPTGKEVCEKQLFNHIDRIEHVDINREDIDDYLPVIFKKLEWMSREGLLTRMVALNFNRFLDYYKDAVDLNVDEKDDRKDRKERKKERDRMDETMKRLYFGVGKNDHVLPQKIIGKINDVTRSKNIPIGRIDLFNDYSYVDVEESFVPMILECFSDPRKNPKGIVVEVAKEQPKREKKVFEEKKDGESQQARRERKERSARFDEALPEDIDEMAAFEKKSKKKPKDDDKPYYKVERSRDGHEWLDPDWRDKLDDIEVFFDEDDVRPSRKKRNEERGFDAKKEKHAGAKKEKGSAAKKTARSSGSRSTKESASSGGGFRSSDYDIGPRSRRGASAKGSSTRSSSSGSSSRGSSVRESGRGRRGAARNEEPSYYSPKRRGGKRR
ncbi:MAG: DbpA RNA binding domain-containing protein, partial [Bacteroidales bacterium]|nr:DbpA RNA binding domain-containing protein [Bacteroidales bacterium]